MVADVSLCSVLFDTCLRCVVLIFVLFFLQKRLNITQNPTVEKNVESYSKHGGSIKNGAWFCADATRGSETFGPELFFFCPKWCSCYSNAFIFRDSYQIKADFHNIREWWMLCPITSKLGSDSQVFWLPVIRVAFMQPLRQFLPLDAGSVWAAALL